jgi:hypothetical protein
MHARIDHRVVEIHASYRPSIELSQIDYMLLIHMLYKYKDRCHYNLPSKGHTEYIY